MAHERSEAVAAAAQQRRPRPSLSEREQRRISTQVNQLANWLPQVNQDFLNLARTQLGAFNSLQRESRANYTSAREQLPSSSPERPKEEDSETLPDAPDQALRSPTPSVIGWDGYFAQNQPARQTTDRYIPNYTERTHLPARHPHAPERPRY